MASTTVSAAPILNREQIGPLLVAPALFASVAAQVCTIVNTASHIYRIPVITADPGASWVAEGDEIAVADPTLNQVDIHPSKVAGLAVVSRELAEDTDPAAAQVVGDGIARDIARQIDIAFFGDLALPAPAGLGSLTTGTVVETATSFTSLDPFAKAIAAAALFGASISAFITSPAEAVALATLKETDISIRPLLGADVNAPTQAVVYGRPLLMSPHVAPKTVWALVKERTFIVVRTDSRIEIDTSVFFTSDRTAVKGTMRVGFGFPHPASSIKITHA